MRSLRPVWISGLIVVTATPFVLNHLWADVPASGNAVSGRESPRPGATKSELDNEAVEVATLIDSVVQPRFLKDAGEFGLRRLAGLNGHDAVLFTAEDKTEKKALEQVDAFGRDYFLAFLHMAHKPGKYVRGPSPGRKVASDVQPHLSRIRTAKDVFLKERLSENQWAALLTLATDRLPELRKGKDESAVFENWSVSMRPVLARKSCLDCHEGAKDGETLGVMLYAIAKKTAERPVNAAGE
jgi:hypothetical protein